VEFTAVKTAAEMKEATFKAVEGADALFMAAAVADFRSARVLRREVKKRKRGNYP